MKHIEKGVSLRHAPRDFVRDLNVDNASTGLVAGILGLSVGVVHISAGTSAGLDSSFIMIWVISYLMINGLFGLFVPAYYRLPLPMANSIPGALMFAAVIPVVGLEAALGASLIAGAISLVAGLTGVMGMVMRLIPMPIVMGMVGGMLLSFGLKMVSPLEGAIVPAAIMILAFFISARLFRKIPPLVVSMAAGLVYLMVTGVDLSGVEATIRFPEFIMPAFTLSAFLTYGLPLAIILVGMETPAGVGLVKGMGYKDVPANGITAVGGVGTMVSAFFNLHCRAHDRHLLLAGGRHSRQTLGGSGHCRSDFCCRRAVLRLCGEFVRGHTELLYFDYRRPCTDARHHLGDVDCVCRQEA